MSGHSKWAQIKRQKASTDQKKGALFSKLARSISLAAKNGGDPATNFKLRLELDRAKDASMPHSSVERAIKRGTGEDKTGLIEDILYEGYGPEGVGILVQTGSDNRNRTTSNLRHIFTKFKGSLGQQGSVAYQFSSVGQILVPRQANQDLDDITLKAIDLGAEDVKDSEEGLEICTSPLDLEKIKTALAKLGVSIASYEIVMKPQIFIEPKTESSRKQILKLIEALEDDEDVIAVHTNAQL